MKTLIINGSPRRKGDTVTLIDKVQESIKGEVRVLDTYYSNIQACVDCRTCWTRSKCSIDDGMSDVYSYLMDVDNVVLASPIYFSELTGSLLSFASRFQYFYASRKIREDMKYKMKKKNAVIVLVAGGDTIDISRPLKTAEIILKHVNAIVIGSVMSLQTDSICGMAGMRANEDVMALKKATELAEQLNEKWQIVNERII